MKILLTYISGATDRQDTYLNLLPAGLCYLQSSLKEAGFDATLGNFSGWSDVRIIQKITHLKPDIVGISQWTHNRHTSLDLARLIRSLNPHCTIIMGGAHATFSYETVLAEDSPVDMVVLGEGEATLLEVATCHAEGREWRNAKGIAYARQGKIIVNPPRMALTDLDSLPLPMLHLEHSFDIDPALQPEFILTSRGCPSACHFCSSPGFWNRRVRFRSPANIVDEIMYNRNRFGLIYFSIRDDTFTADRQRTINFCRLLIKRKAYIIWNCQSRVTALDEELLSWMKLAGCECIQLGVESGSPRILDKLGKSITPSQIERSAAMIRDAGIHLSVYLISDVPGETEEDIGQTIGLIRRIQPNDGYVSPLAYYPGTPLFDDARAAGRIDDNIFEISREAAVYAAGVPGRNAPRLLKALEESAHLDTHAFHSRNEQSEYCYTADVLAGEWYRQSGDRISAESRFREITKREKDNPWGWYLLAELNSEWGNKRMAQECYIKVLKLVPRHGPSRAAVSAMGQ